MTESIKPGTAQSFFYFSFVIYIFLGAHYVQPNYGGLGLEVPANLVSWIFLSCFISAGLLQAALTRQIVISPFLIYLTIGAVLLLLPAFYSGDQRVFTSRLWALFAGVLLYFAFLQFKLDQQQYLKYAYFVCLCLLIKVILYLSQTLIPYDADPSWSKPWENMLFDRIIANFQSTNVAAICFLSGSLLASKLVIERLFSLNKTILLLIYLVLSGLAISLLQSRIGYISALVAAVLMLAICWNREKFRAGLCVLLFLLGFISGIGLSTISQEKQRQLQAEELISDGTRIWYLKSSYSMLPSAP